jgi:hypothetical protein
MHDADAGGLVLLHKPVSPMTLRATVSRLLRDHASAGPPASGTAATTRDFAHGEA